MIQTYKRLAPYFLAAVIGALIGGGLILGYGTPFLAKPIAQNPAPGFSLPPVANAQLSEARNTPIVRAAQAVGPAVAEGCHNG